MMVRQVWDQAEKSAAGQGPLQQWSMGYSPVIVRQVRSDKAGLRSSREVRPHVQTSSVRSQAQGCWSCKLLVLNTAQAGLREA